MLYVMIGVNTVHACNTHTLAHCPWNSPLTSEIRLLPHSSPSSTNKLRTFNHSCCSHCLSSFLSCFTCFLSSSPPPSFFPFFYRGKFCGMCPMRRKDTTQACWMSWKTEGVDSCQCLCNSHATLSVLLRQVNKSGLEVFKDSLNSFLCYSFFKVSKKSTLSLLTCEQGNWMSPYQTICVPSFIDLLR